jgi:peptidoglycan hydrolase-like protein with peptidoglycan-binding domain
MLPAQDQTRLTEWTQGRAQAATALVAEDVSAPSLAAIKAGAVVGKGMEGDSIKAIQKKLTALGFGVQDTGVYGDMTETTVKSFQKAFGLQQNGQLGPTTLNLIERLEKGKMLGQAVAASARQTAVARNTVGQCYAAVSDSLDRKIKPFLTGLSAYMAAPQLAKHPNFVEMKGASPTDLGKLPPGAIVVWGKGHSKHGHISVALGNGKEASDHIAPQMLSHYGGGKARVFVPAQ